METLNFPSILCFLVMKRFIWSKEDVSVLREAGLYEIEYYIQNRRETISEYVNSPDINES